MPKVGDRVIVASTKIGEQQREGTLIGLVGPLINVRWSDGAVSLFKPGAGSVSFAPGNGSGKAKAARKAATKAASKPKAKAAPKKPAAKKKASAKKSAKRR